MIQFQRIIFFLVVSIHSLLSFGAPPPNLSALSSAGYIMSPRNNYYPVHESWRSINEIMSDVTAFDDLVKQIQNVICSEGLNKSVLLIGDPTDTYQYVFSRLAINKATGGCRNSWHVEINANKIEAGRTGPEIQKFWQENILAPSIGKDVILYFRNLRRIIEIGTRDGTDAGGIQSEYAADLTSGRLRVVSFLSEYEYNELVHSRFAYVVNAHSQVLRIGALNDQYLDKIVQNYLKVRNPNLQLNKDEAFYLYQSAKHYQPNAFEPQRSIEILEEATRNYEESNANSVDLKFDPALESKHPYDSKSLIEQEIFFPDVQSIQIFFEDFDTKSSSDTLTIYDANKPGSESLDSFFGTIGPFTTKIYKTNHLKLIFTSDTWTNLTFGYKIKEARGFKKSHHEFTLDEIRKAIYKIIQVPEWLLKNDFSYLTGFEAKVRSDVVGCDSAISDVVNLMKNGFAGGRAEEKPIGSVFFVGPTGTGKSYLAKKTAEFMNLPLITIDMTVYSTPESFDRFMDTVSSSLVRTPFAIYFFEEIDKANKDILDRLFFMLDEGIFYDKLQRPLSARGAFIIMTTNSATDTIIKEKNNPKLKQIVFDELTHSFREAFLNRFDSISIFKPFTDSEFAQLASTLIKKKSDLLKQTRGWSLSVDIETLNFIATNGKSARFGGRPMERLVENVISRGIAGFQINNRVIAMNSQINFTKLPSKNMFRIIVGLNEIFDYLVEPEGSDSYFDINYQNQFLPFYPRGLQELFIKNRMY